MASSLCNPERRASYRFSVWLTGGSKFPVALPGLKNNILSHRGDLELQHNFLLKHSSVSKEMRKLSFSRKMNAVIVTKLYGRAISS